MTEAAVTHAYFGRALHFLEQEEHTPSLTVTRSTMRPNTDMVVTDEHGRPKSSG